MVKKEPTNKQIMTVVTGAKENTEQILEAIGVFSNKVEGRFDALEDRMGKLEHRMGALDSSVKNYLELSDKRYLELRQTNKIIFKYLKLVVQKVKVPVDLS
ncbi:MAG: hypothetical protein AAB729_05715 [Patescibacteria group bacterium]